MVLLEQLLTALQKCLQTSAFIVVCISSFSAMAAPAVDCLLQPQPSLMRISLAHRGFISVGAEDSGTQCENVASEKWIRKTSGAFSLYLFADGPSGRGHYWTVTIGLSSPRALTASHGVCISTATLGWRTLQKFRNRSLLWIDDVDQDGNAEVVRWDSFPLDIKTMEYANSGGWGLMGWVYRLNSEGDLVFDMKLSKKMALEIAAEYKTRINDNAQVATQRSVAAEVLEQFGKGSCVAP